MKKMITVKYNDKDLENMDSQQKQLLLEGIKQSLNKFTDGDEEVIVTPIYLDFKKFDLD